MSVSQENQSKCRACAQTCEESAQINGLVFFLSKKIIYTELTNLEALADDDLPKCLCSKCSDLLDQFKSFKEVCIKSDHYFRNEIFLNLKEEIDDFCFSELLKPKVEMANCNALSDIETGDNSHFDPENLPNPNPSKRKIKRTQCVDEATRSSKRIRKPKLKSKSVIEETFLNNCLQEGCDQKFESISDLEDHQDNNHHDTDDNTSGNESETSQALNIESEAELKSIKKKTPRNTSRKKRATHFKCEFEDCTKEFIKQKNFDVHVKRHMGEKPFSCDICKRPLASIFTLKKHMQLHESKEKRLLTCKQCHRNYSNKESFEDHMRSHSGQQHVCEQCGKCFTAAAKLRAHKNSHQSAVPEQCKDCDKTFTNKTSLNTHRGIWHKQTKHLPIRCLICGKIFKDQKLCNHHCKNVHTVYTSTEYILNCKICSKPFKTKEVLSRHIKVHTDERNYPCPQCPKAFRNNGQLKKHSYFHSGERPIHCEICSKGFYQKCALDIHMNIHKRQWIAEGQQGIVLHVYPRNKKKTTESYLEESD